MCQLNTGSEQATTGLILHGWLVTVMAWVLNRGQPPWPGCGEGFHDCADVKPFLLWAVVMRVRSLSAGRVSVWPHTAVLSAGPGQPPPPGAREGRFSQTPERDTRNINIQNQTELSIALLVSSP